ncbi:hypothetical protein DPMN_105496 [Dreissena polymorpha]|uniref:Uncharacterized protein n=1 Tax=Dreissena polymorpha TaxID=45954 RepID=A0A9D4QHU0_DREPO|nr:hypothetical protein DPMN_105496 [Dreissena polymorpha]
METPSFIRDSNKPQHWGGCPWTWKMHTSMFLYIPTTGSTCDSPFKEARYTSSERCHLGWQRLH